jgi:thiosulfate/3-mercaptopyruvate sulfurtransferase
MPLLIGAPALAAHVGSGGVARLLDVRWRLNAPEGRPAYVTGHLPGAAYVDLEGELSQRGRPEIGRYPLPALGDLEQAARRWGISDGELVVAYDDNDGVAAARAWWLLRRQGIDIRVLDGGIRAWIDAGLPLARGDVAPQRGTVTLTDVDPGVATIDDAARAPSGGHLIDVRAPDQYRGITTGLSPAAGHIPGAINIPAIAHISARGTLKTPQEIRATIAASGVLSDTPIVLYCGTGIASTHSALAFAHAGIETRVFAGSWSQWSLASGRPVAVGRTPADAFDGW